jgi:uncharacterized protein (DUF433 family)
MIDECCGAQPCLYAFPGVGCHRSPASGIAQGDRVQIDPPQAGPRRTSCPAATLQISSSLPPDGSQRTKIATVGRTAPGDSSSRARPRISTQCPSRREASSSCSANRRAKRWIREFAAWLQRNEWRNPIRKIMRGAPVYRGTRIPVHAIAGMLSQGAAVAEILAGYPALTREKVELAPSGAGPWPATLTARSTPHAPRNPHNRKPLPRNWFR